MSPQEAREHSFDELARGLASGSITRGKALRLAGGALLGAALASLPGAALADDDCRGFGRRCRRDRQCCSGNCVRRGDRKVCGCPEGQRRCNDRCVNLQTNERHCGSCTNSCAEGEECVDGVCQGSCPPEGTPLTEGDCNCAYNCLAGDSTPFGCRPDNSCICSQTTEGTGFCAVLEGDCDTVQACSSSDECPSGSKCVVNTCCGFSACFPSCPSV
jgi:hypothetical protein